MLLGLVILVERGATAGVGNPETYGSSKPYGLEKGVTSVVGHTEELFVLCLAPIIQRGGVLALLANRVFRRTEIPSWSTSSLTCSD